MYDPTIGRFLSTDPRRQFASPYVGMGNNAVSGVDPTGGFLEGLGELAETFAEEDGWYLNEAGKVTYTSLDNVVDQASLEAAGLKGQYIGESFSRVDDAGKFLSYNANGTVTNAIPLNEVVVTPSLLDNLKYDVYVAKGFIGGIKDFYTTYNEMLEANWKNSDKYFHAKANLKASMRGPGGEYAAEKMSNLREILDQRFKGDPRSASEADQVANRFGRARGRVYRFGNYVDYSDVLVKYRPTLLPIKY
jgi:serum amyloid A protein